MCHGMRSSCRSVRAQVPGTLPLVRLGLIQHGGLPFAGMDYLHTSGLIHGDLKPANVLLRSTGTDARGFTCKVFVPSPPKVTNKQDPAILQKQTQTHDACAEQGTMQASRYAEPCCARCMLEVFSWHQQGPLLRTAKIGMSWQT